MTTTTADPKLDGCCDSIDHACCCLGALCCPDIAYGLLYAKATHTSPEESCGCPCLAHAVLDAAPATAAHIACASPAFYFNLPLGCCLRLLQRRVIVNALASSASKRSFWKDALIECFCWSCSQTQLHRLLDAQPNIKFNKGISWIGTVALPISSVNDNAPYQNNAMMQLDGNNSSFDSY